MISVLKNPFYAGAYAYGKSEKRTEIVDGRARKSYGHRKPLEEWEVLLKDHHEGYIDWAEFERNQKQLAANAYGKAGGAKSGRGGRALAGRAACPAARCGRRLLVSLLRAARRDSPSIDAIAQPDAWAAAVLDLWWLSHRRRDRRGASPRRGADGDRGGAGGRTNAHGQPNEQQRIVELELQQARYEASLAERRYAACDPDNRLIAAQLEKSWEAALRRVQACQARLEAARTPEPARARS